MGLYAKYVLPRVLNSVMQNDDLTKLRQKIVPEATGDVIEIGFGSGLNLPFYSDKVTSITGIDPSAEMLMLAEEKIADSRVPVEILEESGEHIPFEHGRFDTAVVTWTLCTVPSAERVLFELRRVLKAGGTLLFVEHGRSPDSQVAKWQDRINPIWKKIGGGCNINRPITQTMTRSGFRLDSLTHPVVRGPAILTYQNLGKATPI